ADHDRTVRAAQGTAHIRGQEQHGDPRRGRIRGSVDRRAATHGDRLRDLRGARPGDQAPHTRAAAPARDRRGAPGARARGRAAPAKARAPAGSRRPLSRPIPGLMRRLLALLAALLVSPAALATSEPAGHAVSTDAKLAASVDAYLKPLIGLDVFQGVVLIARGDPVVLARGYGYANVELGVRNTPDHVFRIASLSKPFTQVMLGRLVEQNRLALSDSLSRFLPGFPQGDRITIEMLRTHRAGIPNANSIPFDE